VITAMYSAGFPCQQSGECAYWLHSNFEWVNEPRCRNHMLSMLTHSWYQCCR
jgi:hypothetical protein